MTGFLIASAMLAAAPAATTPTAVPTDPATVIHAGTLIGTPGQAPLRIRTIVVRDHRITEIHAGFLPAADFGSDAKLVDLSTEYVLPGLMDLHVHFANILSANRGSGPSATTIALKAANRAEAVLERGVTTVRDVGDPIEIVVGLRDSIAGGETRGPRMFVTGPIVSPTAGHGSKLCDGVDACRRAVRENVHDGADLIKAGNSGSASEELGEADAPANFFEDEMKAVIDTASRLRRSVAVHAHSRDSINMALRDGARTIEHGTYFDEESVRLFKQTGAYLVPTDWIGEFMVTSPIIQQRNSPADWIRIQKIGILQKQLSGRAWRAGIKLGVGTDALNGMDVGATIREIEIFEENGIPSGEAIKAATVNGADILGHAGDLGQIKIGFYADIVATPQDPLATVKALRAIDFVMKDGGIVRLPDKH